MLLAKQHCCCYGNPSTAAWTATSSAALAAYREADPLAVSVSDQKVASCLDPELPVTGLQGRGVGCGVRPAQLERKESVGTQQN